MNALAWACLISLVGAVAQAIVVYFARGSAAGRRERQAWVAILVTGSVTLWTAFMSVTTLDPVRAIAWWRLTHCFAMLAVLQMYRFATVVLGLSQRRINAVLYAVTAALVLLTASPLVVNNPRLVFGEFYLPTPTPWYVAFSAYLIGVKIWGCLLLWQGIRTEPERLRRIQLGLILLGLALAYCAMDLVLLPIYGVDLYPYSIYAVPVALLIVTYAILRHHALELEAGVRRTVVFAGVLLTMMALIGLVSLQLPRLLQPFGLAWHPVWGNLLSALIIVLLFDQVRTALVNLTDRYLFQKRYDYRRFLKTFSNDIMVLADLQRLVQTTVTTLVETMKLHACGLWLRDEHRLRYNLVAAQGVNGAAQTMDAGDPLVAWFRQRPQPLGREAEPAAFSLPDAIRQRLDQLQAALCLPLLVQGELIGMLSLGPKKSDEPFTPEDVDVLTTVANTLAVALSNAALYDRVQRLNLELSELNAQLEAKVAQRTQELARSNADLEQFAYVASHDLQEPLRMVSGYTQLLAKRYRGHLDTDADEFIGYAVGGVERMQRLINDLLTYSRVDSRRQPLAPVDCTAILAQVLDILKTAMAEKQAVVTHDSLPRVMGDALQLGQVFQNLIGNALKFHKPGEPPRVDVSAAPHEGAWRFSIRDHGIGIEPAHAGRLFGMFQRLHTTQEYPGTGIGLAVCKKIVERHGGRIWIESAPGQGTTFYFTLPEVTTEPQQGGEDARAH